MSKRSPGINDTEAIYSVGSLLLTYVMFFMALYHMSDPPGVALHVRDGIHYGTPPLQWMSFHGRLGRHSDFVRVQSLLLRSLGEALTICCSLSIYTNTCFLHCVTFGRIGQHENYFYGVWQCSSYNSANFHQSFKIVMCETLCGWSDFGPKH